MVLNKVVNALLVASVAYFFQHGVNTGTLTNNQVLLIGGASLAYFVVF